MTESGADLESRMQQLEAELKTLKAQRASAKPPRRRLQIEFSDETYQLLRRQAAAKNTSMANIIRDAIRWTRWLEETVQEGRLFVKEDDGEIYRIKRL